MLQSIIQNDPDFWINAAQIYKNNSVFQVVKIETFKKKMKDMASIIVNSKKGDE